MTTDVRTQFGTIQIGIVILTLITTVIHLILGIQTNNTLFILNGIGYLGLLAALYLPLDFLVGLRDLVRWVLIGYAAVTIVLFFVFNGAGAFSSVLGLITKVVEVVLIVLLWMDRR